MNNYIRRKTNREYSVLRAAREAAVAYNSELFRRRIIRHKLNSLGLSAVFKGYTAPSDISVAGYVNRVQSSASFDLYN